MSADLTGQTLRGRYRVLKRLGEGAMSDVYLVAHSQHPGMRYALKVLKAQWMTHGDFPQRFRAEGRTLERLEHPGIVRMHDFFEDRSGLCMVLDFIEGRSLADHLARRGAMPANEALAMFRPILEALDYAHQHGVVHRDVKPSNVLLDKALRPLLCDFGIARQLGQAGLTMVGVSLGTPAYMSPEQIQSPWAVDHRSDMYAAGIMLFEMLTGRVPFGADPQQPDEQILREQVHQAPPDPRRLVPSLNPRLAEVLAVALRKEPGRRMQGASEFLQALDGVQRGAAAGPAPRSVYAHASHDGAGAGPADDAPAPRHSGRSLVYEHPSLGQAEVPQGLCWPALLAGPLWLLHLRLFRLGLVWLGVEALLLALVLMLLTDDGAGRAFGPLAALLGVTAGLLWAAPALRANQWYGESLEREGYVELS